MISEYTPVMGESCNSRLTLRMQTCFRCFGGGAMVAAGLLLSGPALAQEPEIPVFDLIYLDEPLSVASLPDAQVELVAQRPAAPTIVLAAFHAMPNLPPDAGSRAITQRFKAEGSSAPLLPQAAPMDAPIIRLASLTAPNAADIFILDPSARVVGRDVTDTSPEAAMTEVELATALQEELARVGCYRMRVDGQWGPGSRRSLNSYLERSGQRTDTQEPSVELLLMVRASEVEVCPAPVARAPRATQPATTTQPARTAQPARPAPQPAAPSGPTVSVGGGNVTVQGTVGGVRLQGAIRGGLR